jgi:hypothetical protein
MTSGPREPGEQFEEPQEGAEEDADLGPLADAEAEAGMAGLGPSPETLPEVPPALVEAKRGIEEQLLQRAEQYATLGARELEAQGDAANVQGVALGFAEEGGAIDRAVVTEPGAPALTIYTAEPAPKDRVRSLLVKSMGIEAAASPEEVPLHVVPTGIIDALPHRFRLRPAPGGISVAHVNVTAGTIGCLAFGRSAPRNSRVLVLSNNHVLANVNNAKYGDCVCQPGPADGGKCPADQIAILERFTPIALGGAANYVDCATAWAWPDRVRTELVYLAGGVPKYFKINNTPLAPYLGMPVGKSGRTTQVTSGRVTAIGASLWVNYGGVSAWFTDQIAIQAYSGNFSQPGDSGSSVWTWDATKKPVGLLFAGGGAVTFANRIDRVMTALDIWLYT